MTTIAKTQAEVMRQILDGSRTELHTAMPGTVVSYDASAQTADIRPGVQRVIPSIEDEDEDARETLPILPSVPVAWPRAGSFFLHGTLSKGDGVLVIFCEADINAWLEGNESADPGTPERHGLSGAVAIPGLYPSANPVGDVTNPSVGLDGAEKIEWVSGRIDLAGGSDFVALAAKVLTELNAIRTTFNAHVHVETGATTQGPSTPMGAPSSVAATKVKAT